ncbi:GNAT family protein [Myroides pelagicus]|uniref:GNAT family N-acetyltransferase n=1 Tax=Myroides pelagicus TaxID=270914 RepID=UPI002DB58150|nr:GNAT family protein [Myroides pelagicus]MEC4114146.1 GNAT family protein [Myroides pelagicus]
MNNFTFNYIETSRFKLRILEAEAYQAFLKSATDQEIAYYIGIPYHQITYERTKGAIGFRTFNKSYKMFIIVDKATDHVIGHCGFHTWYVDHHRAEIGYALYQEQWKGRGVMTEVLRAVLTYGFDRMKLIRVEAFISPENIASLNTVKKFGFTQEGLLRNQYINNGEIEDSILHRLLVEEFQS